MKKYSVLVTTVLLSILVLTVAGCGASSPTPSVPPSAVFYTDTLGAGWEDWSWDCQRNFKSTASVHEGQYAIAVDYAEKGWGGLAFGRHDPISTKGYDRLEFWIHGGASGGQLLRVSFNTCPNDCELPPGGMSINNPKYIEDGVVSPNTWKLVSIPLADLGAVDASIVKLNIMDNSGSTQPTFYIDDVVLTAAADATPVTTSIPVATPTLTPVPSTPAPTLTSACEDHVASPQGSVPFGAKACSPDDTKFAREIKPAYQGRIGIFDRQTDELLREIDMRETNNDLKGLAWSPDSKWLAIMYHHGPGGYIAIVDVGTGDRGQTITISEWYHDMVFSSDGTKIMAGIGDILPISTAPIPTVPPKLSAISAPPDFQRGINYGAWWQGQYSTSAADESLTNLAATGSTWIALIVTGYQEGVASTTITYTLPRTPTDDDLIHVIDKAHDLGLKVMLKPHLDLNNDPDHWRGQIGIQFTTETQWQAWFASYSDFINHYAALAQDNGVEQLCVGTELVGTSGREGDWRNMIAGARNRFSGLITYASNHDGEETSIQWWDAVDYIGVDAYYSLTNKNAPTLEELKDAWKSSVTILENLANREQKPIILTEIGYRSINGANRSSWEWQSSEEIDLQEQADCYQAVLETIWGKGWLKGIYWWNWDTDPTKGGPNNPDYTPFGKPAEEVLKAYYLN